MSRVGLVLGAGGVTGAAFHAGTLLALEHDLGWDPRSADLIVGTSAGSIVGGLLRAGLSTDDLSAWAALIPAGAPGRSARELLDEIEAMPVRWCRPPFGLRSWSPRQVTRVFRSEGPPAHTKLASLIPAGWVDASEGLQRLGELVNGWPRRPLWIPAVRRTDGQRIVFGRDDTTVPLGLAIAASAAVPAIFRPVAIGPDQFIDGAAHSPTSADLLVDSGVDVAIVLSPMSGHRGSLKRRRPDHLVRAVYRRRVESECEALTAAGIEVVVLEPGAATLEVMGVNPLDRRRASAVVRESYLGALVSEAVRERLRRALWSRVEGEAS